MSRYASTVLELSLRTQFWAVQRYCSLVVSDGHLLNDQNPSLFSSLSLLFLFFSKFSSTVAGLCSHILIFFSANLCSFASFLVICTSGLRIKIVGLIMGRLCFGLFGFDAFCSGKLVRFGFWVVCMLFW